MSITWKLAHFPEYVCHTEIVILMIMFVHLKAKDTYHARCFELEKLKRESANQKDCERAEMKMKRAREFICCFSDAWCFLLEILWPHHMQCCWWRPSPCSCCCDSQASIRLEMTFRKTQPHVAHDLQNILRQSYDYLMIMPKLRSTYDERLIYKTSCEGRKAILRYDLLAKL